MRVEGMDYDVLQACPFCGGRAKLRIRRTGNWRTATVQCVVCGGRSGAAQAPYDEGWRGIADEAVANWNRRAKERD